MNIHEPRRTTRDIRKLRTRVAEDASFASLVFDVREVMDEHCASPNLLRAAVRLVLHEDEWINYRIMLTGLKYELEDDVEEEPEEEGREPWEL